MFDCPEASHTSPLSRLRMVFDSPSESENVISSGV